ncbi:SDR family oxidoreductase [Pendulispora rubella]|uniref:SDR family oxidoreductase n=1 Tax=Pendulispora rubella TaxID=2741070 RepID=A0ABZ2LBI9_9BACT
MTNVVVISGGGTGIGFASAVYFARKGAQLVLLGRRAHILTDAAKRLAAELPAAPAALCLTGDLSAAESAEGVVGRIREAFTHVDVLVNAAGGSVVMQASDAQYADGLAGVARRWTDNFRLNVLSTVLLTEGLRDRLRSPGGRILFVSSIAAYRGSVQGCYAAAKAALHPYTYDLATALGPKGITVNTVAPGYIRDTEFFGEKLSDERRETLIAQTMNKRPGTPEDVANTIGWLASPEASHVTGQIIQVNGGAERGR